jgi:hypothetical protein
MMNYLNMAVFALVGTIAIGCSSDDENTPLPPTTAQVPQPEAFTTVTLTTTVSRGGESNARTRALSAEGVKTFAEGDQIAVVYTNTNSERVVAISKALEESDITNEGKNAKMTVTLTNPVAGSVDYIYPAAMAKSDGSINYSALCMQDGTLATLARKLDCAKGTGELLNTGNDFALPTHIGLVNQFAICEFTIKNSGGTEITGSLTGLTLTDGTNTYTVSREAAAGPVYVAMQPVTSDKTLSFVANDDLQSYYKNVSGKALAANDMVPVNLTMIPGRTQELASLGADYTTVNGDMLTGKLAAGHQISIAAGAIVILNGVSINYDASPVLSGPFAGITCSGNATLIVSGTDFVKGFSSGYPGIFVPSGYTLTVTGDGTLYTDGHANAAGIGSSSDNIADYRACGNIVIQGGTIWATGGSGAAGIGSGASIIYTEYETPHPSSCGDITIRSSVTQVNATAGSGAAGIGSGQYSTCGTVSLEDPSKIMQ